VGDSPEVYSIINVERAAGQVISFSQEPSEFSFEQEISTSSLLAVLNHPYNASDKRLQMDLKFEDQESTSAVFVLPNEETGISIVSSTSSLRNAFTDDRSLTFEVNEPGSQTILWPIELGEPVLGCDSDIEFQTEKKNTHYQIQTQVIEGSSIKIRIDSSNE